MPLSSLLEIRHQLISFYKKNERFIMPVIKFIMTVSVLLILNNATGYAKPLTKTSVILIIGLVSMFLPPQLIMLTFILLTSLHALAGSLEAGIVVFALFLIIYLLFIRLYPKESLFILGTVIAYKLNIPYIIPLMAGLFSSLAAIVALIIGVIIWYSAPQIIIMMEDKTGEIADIVAVINTRLTALQEMFKDDKTLIASIFILSVVLLTVYIIRKQNIDYAEYIAILVGTVMNLVGFLFAVILLSINVGIMGLILSTLISAIIASGAQFFSKVADYSRAEVVQFEDDKNYYYVKVVPKIIVQKSVKPRQQNLTEDSRRYSSREN